MLISCSKNIFSKIREFIKLWNSLSCFWYLILTFNRAPCNGLVRTLKSKTFGWSNFWTRFCPKIYLSEIWWCPKVFCPKFPKKRPKVCPKLFFRNFSVPKSSILMYLPVRWTYIIFEMRSVGNFWNRKLVTSSVGLPTFGSILGLFRKCDFWGLFFCCRKAFDQHIFV